MINNIALVKPLLDFSEKGAFYMLYVLKRKKDQPEGERDNHQSVRTIRVMILKLENLKNYNYGRTSKRNRLPQF